MCKTYSFKTPCNLHEEEKKAVSQWLLKSFSSLKSQITEYTGLKGTYKHHQVQLLNDFRQLQMGIEPTTLVLSAPCSNQLS